MDIDPDDAQFFARLSQDLMSRPHEASTFERVVQRAVDVVGPCTGAALSLRRRGRTDTVAASERRSHEVDTSQYDLDEGPCREAAMYADYQISQDLSADERWPRWTPIALGQGVLSVLSVQLRTDAEVLGALNFYADTAAGWTSDAVDVALLYAAHATNALASARLVANLTTALNRRHAVGVAEGIVMGQLSVDMQTAFDLLTEVAARGGVSIHDVAQGIVDTGRLPAELAARAVSGSVEEPEESGSSA